MKTTLSLQFKLLIAVALVIVLTLSVLIYLVVDSQRKLSRASFRDLAIALAQALDAGIGSKAELDDIDKLQSDIYKIMWLNADITQISINLPTKDGLKVAASNNTALVGKKAALESFSSYQEGIIFTETLVEPEGAQTLRVITPVHVGGQRVGTYDIRLSLDALEENILKTQRQFLLGAITAVLVIISTLFLLMRATVINPIKVLQKGMKKIGGGELDYKIKIKRRDEIGDLAFGLNEMAEELKESYEFLEKKVAERTHQLNLKVKELEKFRKFAVGREIKMVELKKEIKRLEESPKKEDK